MALSSLVPQTVSSISLLAKSTITGLQIWSLYGLLLTIEASGFSYVSHVQVLEFVFTLYCSKGGIIVSIIVSLYTSKDGFSLTLLYSFQSCLLLPFSLCLKQWSILVTETCADAWESAPLLIYCWWFDNFDHIKEGLGVDCALHW